jgi:prevent-host-death family protein
MNIYDISYVHQHLERLIDEVAQGHPFLIAVAGVPVVRVVSVAGEAPSAAKRFGFLAGEIAVPDDFDRMDYGDTFTTH